MPLFFDHSSSSEQHRPGAEDTRWARRRKCGEMAQLDAVKPPSPTSPLALKFIRDDDDIFKCASHTKVSDMVVERATQNSADAAPHLAVSGVGAVLGRDLAATPCDWRTQNFRLEEVAMENWPIAIIHERLDQSCAMFIRAGGISDGNPGLAERACASTGSACGTDEFVVEVAVERQECGEEHFDAT